MNPASYWSAYGCVGFGSELLWAAGGSGLVEFGGLAEISKSLDDSVHTGCKSQNSVLVIGGVGTTSVMLYHHIAVHATSMNHSTPTEPF